MKSNIEGPVINGGTSQDAQLLDRVRRGDDQAMAALYDRYSKVVYSVALRVLRDPASAEDVLQDVFLGLWRRPETFVSARGTLGGWLAVVARNRRNLHVPKLEISLCGAGWSLEAPDPTSKGRRNSGLRIVIAVADPKIRPWTPFELAKVLDLHNSLAALAHELKAAFQV